MNKNYQVVREINANAGPYDCETIKSEFPSIEKALRWGQRNMHNMPFSLRNDGEPLTLPERETLAALA